MTRLGRRDLLSRMGLGAGAWLLGPMFGQMLPEALGQTATRKRFIVITNGNGFIEKQYTCAARSETDFDLSAAYEPLAPWKAQMVIASKFYNPHDRALHGNQFATLSVMPSPIQTGEKRGPPGGISIDRFLAQEIGAKDTFPSTAVGIAEGRNILCVSCDGLGKPYPAIGSPVKAYEAWFGGGVIAGGDTGIDAAKLLAQDRSLLDLVRTDVARMNARLAGPEKAKLDQYLDSLRGVERQLGELAGARNKCQPPPARPGAEVDKASLSPAVVAAHVDVTFAAQLCGLTRVSHISILGMEGPHNSYGWLGDTSGHHNQHHAGNMAIIGKIDQFVLSNVARMVEHLAKTPEGNGTMLDSSLVTYINTCGGKHHGGQDTHAVVMLGKAGGALRTGRYLQYPVKQHCISDVFVSMANMFGVASKTFGDPMHCKGPLPGLA